MSHADYFYITTDLNEEEILRLFVRETYPLPPIETFTSKTRFVKWIETDYYSIEAERIPEVYAKVHDEDFGIKPNMKIVVSYIDGHVTDGRKDILYKAARFIGEFKGDIFLLYNTLGVLKRIGSHLKLAKDIWNSDLLTVIDQEYELVDGQDIE